MTQQAILETVVKHLVRTLGAVNPADVDPEQAMATLGVSSLETIEAITGATRELGIRVPMSELNSSMNLLDLADLILLYKESKGAVEVPTIGVDEPEALADLRRRMIERLGRSERRARYDQVTYDMFLGSTAKAHDEVVQFNRWLGDVSADGRYAFETTHMAAQRPEVRVQRETGEAFDLVNLASYNYLGLSYHPEVIQAAKDALDTYGLGATSSPISSGTLQIHRQLEDELVSFFGVPGWGASLFTSGFAVNVGAISALLTPGSYIVCDRAAHMSILEGAQLSRARLRYFDHNDMASLEAVLQRIADKGERILICIEGVYSADGDYGRVAETVALAKRYGAMTLVDEAHSMLLTGERGRGVCDAQGVLAEVDLLVMTFSKAFAGVGGALVARREITRYVNWYARCRMFSCAMDPAVTGGILKALQLAASSDGDARRARLHTNTALIRGLLQGKVRLGTSESWIVPVIFGSERHSIAVSDALQRRGLDAGVLTFPAAARGEARIRLFITSEHSEAQLRRAAQIILDTAQELGFSIDA